MPKQSYDIIFIYQIKKYINSNKELMASTPPVAFAVVMEAKEFTYIVCRENIVFPRQCFLLLFLFLNVVAVAK